MGSFQGLSDATQATINAVAPGISEALVAPAWSFWLSQQLLPIIVMLQNQIHFCNPHQSLLKSCQHFL